MTEEAPILAYRPSEYRRRPLFVAIAIITLIAGALSEITLIASIIQTARPGVGGLSWNNGMIPYPALLSFAVDLVAIIFLIGGAIAFLAKSKWVATLVSGYLVFTILNLLLNLIMDLITQSVGSPGSLTMTNATMSKVFNMMFDVVVLLMIQTRVVRQLIDDVTGIDRAIR